MPEKLIPFWESIPPSVRAAFVGSIVAFLRVMYDGREPSLIRRFLECLLCGAISLCVTSLAQAAGISADYSTFTGGAIGLLGADQVRIWARRAAAKRAKSIL